MKVVDVGKAKGILSVLLAEVEAGGEIIISRRGRPIAKLVGLISVVTQPAPSSSPPRKRGSTPPLDSRLRGSDGHESEFPRIDIRAAPRREAGVLRRLSEWRDFKYDRSLFAPLSDDELADEGWRG